MDTVDITGQPLVARLVYFSKLTDLPHYALTTTDVLGFIPELELIAPKLKSALQTLKPYLSKPLGSSFDDLWLKNKSAIIASLQAQIFAKLGSNARLLSDLKFVFPASGTVTAEVFNRSPAQKYPGILYLYYQLSGCDASAKIVGMAGDVSFDTQAAFEIILPLLPFDLTANATVSAGNAALHSDSTGVTVVEVFDTLGNIFSFGLVPSINDLLQEYVDVTEPLTSLLGLDKLLSTLNAAGPHIVEYGFNQCVFTIENPENPNTLTLTITHPLDPAPILQNSYDPRSTYKLSNPPALSASTDQLGWLQAFTVVGSYFPVESTDRVTLQWNNTSTGKPAGAQIKYEISGQATATPIYLPKPASLYRYTVTGLVPDTEYSFWARCSDTFTWSEWNREPVKIKTAAASLVQLVMKSVTDPTIPSVVLGSVGLSTTSSQWTCPATIPFNTAYGNYTLSAELSGKVLATTEITVEEIPLFILELIDPTTHLVVGVDQVYPGGSACTVRGERFPNGNINLILTGVEPPGRRRRRRSREYI